MDMDVDEDPLELVGPRPAAVRGEEKRRASADEEEFRRHAPRQSGAKRAQAKANWRKPSVSVQGWITSDSLCICRKLAIDLLQINEKRLQRVLHGGLDGRMGG